MVKSGNILTVLLCCIIGVQQIRGMDFLFPAESDTLYIMQTLPFEEGEKGDKCVWDFSNIKDSVLCPIIIERTDTTSVNIHTKGFNVMYSRRRDTLYISDYETSQIRVQYGILYKAGLRNWKYRDSVGGTYTGHGEYGHTFPLSIIGNNYVCADGIGRLLLPQLQIDSVVRIHLHSDSWEENTTNIHSIADIYRWVVPYYPYILCETQYIRYATATDTIYNHTSYYAQTDSTEITSHNLAPSHQSEEIANNVSETDKILTAASFLPNPVSDRLCISYCISQTAQVHFSLHSNSGISYIQTPLKTQEAGEYQLYMDVSPFPTGTYVLYIYVNDYVLAETIIKI